MRPNKSFRVTSHGNSMYPLLQDGDTIECIKISPSKIQLDDIVLVYSNALLVAHRVIRIGKNRYITRGDNNLNADKPVKKKEILAKVVRFKRGTMWWNIRDVYLFQSKHYIDEIQRLETLLNHSKIKHIYLKGVLVSLQYEGTIPKRVYADCDILVSRTDIKKVLKMFALLGYRVRGRTLFGSLANAIQYDKPEISMVKMVNGMEVVFDVHFEPVFLMTQIKGMDSFYPADQLIQLGNGMIERGVRKRIKGFSYWLPSISDQIVYLALHIFHHNFEGSARYRLLDTVIRKRGVKVRWEEVVSIIGEFQLGGYEYLVFALLRKYYKTPIPYKYLDKITPPRMKKTISRYLLGRIDIFNQQNRMMSGITRILFILIFSPQPLARKLLFFIRPTVISISIMVVWRRLLAGIKRPHSRMRLCN